VGATEVEQLLELTKDWSPKARINAMEAFEERKKNARRVWYCKSPGRRCNGKPHPGYPYPHARGDQWPPPGDDWFVWALRGGRGSGKTRSGAEWTRRMSKHVPRIALLARTTADIRETVVEGESGLLAVCAYAGEKVEWEPSKHRVTFENGAVGYTYSGEEPDRLRGPQHGAGWADEPAHYPAIEDVWSNLLFGMRLGERPRIAVTTAPKPHPWMTTLIKKPTTVAVKVSTYANIDNLATTFAEMVLSQYEGTRLGQQELYGEILEDVEGALWQTEMFTRDYNTVDFVRIVVAVDPAGTENKRADETGIMVIGLGRDGRYYVLEDATGKYSPAGWADKAIDLHESYGADAIIAEKNYGGDMVAAVINSQLKERKLIARIRIVTATRGKAVRAEPIVGLYEQEKVVHPIGVNLTALETEQLLWVPSDKNASSPNRIDALVWGITDLSGSSGDGMIAAPVQRQILAPSSSLRRSGIASVPALGRRPF
jgi:predicted phage terminase large subunit-like protein